jgi:hypothetical protein|tara:strand:- start:2836 stop:3105 length:270 start_codon:yes stop_codon:yes gene_type:complete
MATKEMVDLKPKAEKITEEQLTELQKLVNDNNALAFKIGNLESQKHMLVHDHAQVQGKITNMQVKFEEEYGTFDINLKDGTINYPEDGE